MKRLLFSIATVFCSLVTVALIVSLITRVIPDYQNNSLAVLVVQALNTIILYGISPIVALRFTADERPLAFLSLNRGIDWLLALLIILFAVLVFPAVNMLAEFNMSIHLPDCMSDIETSMRSQEAISRELTSRLTETDSVAMLLGNILVMALLPALCEEMFFRGWLQTSLIPAVGKHIAVWISAFIFSAIHMQFFSFIPRLLLGAALGYIFLYSGSLWAPVIAHFFNNLIVLLIAFLRHNNLIHYELESLGADSTLYAGIISFVISLAIIILIIRRQSVKSQH